MTNAGRTEIVHGGERNRRSSVRTIAGTAWNDRSEWKGIGGAQSGRTRAGSIVFRPQYRMLTRTSIGALITARTFLTRKSLLESVISDKRPIPKVAVARDRPIMVRYCICHPYESFIGFGLSTSHRKEYAKLARPAI